MSEVKELLSKYDNIVFLTGAGVSTMSGLPDFRSGKGLYKKYKHLNLQDLLSVQSWRKNPKQVAEFLDSLNKDVKPNMVHDFIKSYQDSGKLRGVITQNLDNLHELSGVDKVLHLHGEFGYECCHCGEKTLLDPKNMSRKGNFKSQCHTEYALKPKALLYGEQYNTKVVKECFKMLEKADLLVCMGTELDIHVINNIFKEFKKDKVFINGKDVDFGFQHVTKFIGKFSKTLVD